MIRHIIPISGKDSLATALVMREREPQQRFEYVWNDTGWELPEVYEWIDNVQSSIGEIIRCGDDLTEIVNEQGLLPSAQRRFCTKYAKIFPMRDMLKGSKTVIYFGLRADEPERIAGMVENKNQTYRFPLHEMGIGLEDVWRIVSKTNLMPPQFIWDWMVNRVSELGGYRPSEMPDWQWNRLFSGRSRPNCDRCFFQRQYEWIWLLETHPERFWSAVEMEKEHQIKSPFKLLGKDKPLHEIANRADEIKEKRARKIVSYLQTLSQKTLFELDEENPFGQVSCGLYCGK